MVTPIGTKAAAAFVEVRFSISSSFMASANVDESASMGGATFVMTASVPPFNTFVKIPPVRLASSSNLNLFSPMLHSLVN